MPGRKSPITATLPWEWEKRLIALERLNAPDAHCPRIAVFDLDNTLLIHDVGEAVFALLRRRFLEGKLPETTGSPPLSWPRYIRLLESGQRRQAYCRVVAAMAGLSADTVAEITREVMNWPMNELMVEGARVPVPRPDPVMLHLMQHLKQNNFELFVVSASNHITVRIVAAEFLGINPDHAWGIRSLTATGNQGEEVFATELASPVPYGKGKVDLFRLKLGNCVPLVSAGDSVSDIPLLNLTPRDGAVFWAGEPDLPFRQPSPFRYPANVLVHRPIRS